MNVSPKALVCITCLACAAGGIITRAYIPRLVEVSVTKDRIVTVIKEHKNADGSSDTETHIDEHKTEKDTRTTNVVPPNWIVSAGASVGLYQASVQRRILGPVFVGGYAQTNGTVGLSLGVEF